MRRWVLDTAPKFNVEAHEVALPLEDIKQADEVILTNSLIGLWPVKMFESNHYQPGPVYQTLIKFLIKKYPLTRG